MSAPAVAARPAGLEWYPAPAKLNLALHVTGRRADGYHLLETVFRFIDLADSVGLETTEEGRIARVVDLPGVSEDDDLSVRAARALQAATGCRRGARIALDKRIPQGGGLGGGSSDAATVLIALNHRWGTGLDSADLQAIGLTLGADVPVFVYGRTALARGIGERFEPIDAEPAWYVVLTPPVAVATREVFSAPELTRNAPPVTISGSSGARLRFPLAPGRNDLEAVVTRRFEAVAVHLAWLRQQGPAAMSGSGACVFAAFATEAEARAVFARRPPPMQGFVAAGLDRHPLAGLVPGA